MRFKRTFIFIENRPYREIKVIDKRTGIEHATFYLPELTLFSRNRLQRILNSCKVEITPIGTVNFVAKRNIGKQIKGTYQQYLDWVNRPLDRILQDKFVVMEDE
jgi:hypothetical protein